MTFKVFTKNVITGSVDSIPMSFLPTRVTMDLDGYIT